MTRRRHRRTAGLPVALAVTLALGGQTAGQAPPHFDTFFRDKTMRVDYVHSGGHGQQIIGLDQVVSDGPWAGSRTRLVDGLNLGKYLFEVIDRRTNQVLYSRGFASIYGEWETTAEFRANYRSFRESLRFPWPKAPVQVVLKTRDAENSFHELWSTVIDPDSRFVNPTDREPQGEVWSLFENGPSSEKVDLLVISEGYTAAEIPKFHADATRLMDALFEEEPFRSRKGDFNVRGLDLPSAESGVSRPRAGQFRRTPLSAEYNIFDSERYLLTYDNRALRDAASAAPYEFLEILVNEEQYGGGGIFNFQATAAGRHRVRRVCVRSRVRTSLRRAGRRVLHVGCGLRDRCHVSPGAVGAEHHRVARPRQPEVGRPDCGRHPVADAVGQGGLRGREHGRSAANVASCGPTGPPRR